MCNNCLDISSPPSQYMKAQWKIYRGQISRTIYRNKSFLLIRLLFFKRYSVRTITFKPFYIVTGVETSLFKKEILMRAVGTMEKKLRNGNRLYE